MCWINIKIKFREIVCDKVNYSYNFGVFLELRNGSYLRIISVKSKKKSVLDFFLQIV